LTVRTAEGDYHKFEKAGTEFAIVLMPELATRLHQQLIENVLVRGDYPALVRMRVEKAPGNNRFRGVVEMLEFLYFIDARPLEGRLLNKALFVVGVTEEGAGPRHSPFHKEWEARLTPTQIIPKVRNLYIQEGRPVGYKDLAIKASKPNIQTDFSTIGSEAISIPSNSRTRIVPSTARIRHANSSTGCGKLSGKDRK
jgi:hypothetical protein